jgi:hypothetical protein
VKRSHVRFLLLVLLGSHLLLGVVRIPYAVFPKRRAEAARYQEVGRVRYLLDTKRGHGWEAVEWLLRNTPPNSVILWRGEYKGSFELAGDLLFPRLLYEASRVPPDTATLHDRPVAPRVLVGLGNDLELVPR